MSSKKIEFYKLQASGNDFILIDARKLKGSANKTFYKNFAKKYCQPKTGIGADGLLIIEGSKRVAFKMRIINSDGSEAEMCGNGARCAALWAFNKQKRKTIKFDTIAGIIEAGILGKSSESNTEIKIKTTNPFGLKLNFALSVCGRKLKVNFINTGVPHVVIFVQGLDNIDVNKIGSKVRYHKKFHPCGANVNFVEILGNRRISLRTYERGVEAETLACGTGTVASAIMSSLKLQDKTCKQQIKALTRGKEELKVSFQRCGKKISEVWLQGQAYLVYKGEINIGGKIC